MIVLGVRRTGAHRSACVEKQVWTGRANRTAAREANILIASTVLW